MSLPPLPCPFCGHVGLDFGEGTTFRWLAYSCGGCGTGNETRMQTLGDGTPDENYGSWKGCVLKYDRAPFEAADAIEQRDYEIKRLRAALVECEHQTHSLRVWSGSQWSYHPPQAGRIAKVARAALAAAMAETPAQAPAEGQEKGHREGGLSA